jgi:hypothetical protein
MTIFDTISIDREKIKWEDHLLDLTPVENYNGVWYKRDDKFAPLGDNGINGTKLRQLIWIVNEQAVKAGKDGIIHGAVTGSPQHNMTATVCKHFGVRNIDVIGTKKIKGHSLLEKAKETGVEFEYSKVGYAKTLQAKAKELQEEKYQKFYHMETNITINHENKGKDIPQLVEAFHEVGSHQVKNIPDEVETMIVPAGSCNSVTSVMYGLARFPPKNLKKVYLAGIGNFGSKDPDYIRRRLDVMGKAVGWDISGKFDWKLGHSSLPFDDDEKIEVDTFDVYGGCGNLNCNVCHEGKNYAKYSDTFTNQYIPEINFHPRYENKIISFLHEPDHKEFKEKHRTQLRQVSLEEKQ